MLSTAASTVMYASSMVYTSTPTFTSETIMYKGLQDQGNNILIQQASHLPTKLKMQGKGQLDNQLQEWQMRQEAQKQVERAVTAHRLTIERNIRILEMGTLVPAQKINTTDELQIQNNDSCRYFDSSPVDTTKQIMVPSFIPIPSLVYPPGTISIPMYYPVHNVATKSVMPTQDDTSNASVASPAAPKDIGDIPPFPLPGQYTSHNAWLNWHRTTSPTPYMRVESQLEESTAAAPYDPAQMCLDYLPFKSENEITKSKIDGSTKDSSSISYDSDDEEYLVVYC